MTSFGIKACYHLNNHMSLFRYLAFMVCLQYSSGTVHSGSSSMAIDSARKKAIDLARKQALCFNQASQCTSVTNSVHTNLIRALPCEGDMYRCMVVVNDNVNTAAQCNAWSPYSFWDGTLCVCRCDLLGGVMYSSMGENWCFLNGNAVVKFETYLAVNDALIDSSIIFGNPMSDFLYLAPILCGTWLGVRESASNGSLFSSSCFSILENRNALYENASLSPCGIDKYTTGCRFIGPWVPECRNTSSNECGVQIPCPAQNPCGLGDSVDSNLDNKYSTCDSVTHLALNFTATPSNYQQWNKNAFVLDGRCVSSSGVIDH